MPDYILVQGPNQQWHRAAEQNLPDEATLQRLIREHPETLPFDDLGDDVPPMLIVGRETALPNGYADVIGVDPDGLITIIECKLDRNPDVKRTVIGQVLGYGAYFWGMDFEQFEAEVARKYFDSAACHRADLQGVPLADAMDRFRQEQALGDEWDEAAFRAQLEANLNNGRFRLVIVVDKVNNELRRTVEYLNACTGPNFDILCAELRYFATEGAKLLVPTLIGKPLARKATGQRAAGGGSSWTPERFFADLHERKHDEAADQAARRLLAWCQQQADKTYWGTGTRDGSYSALVRWNPERVANTFTVWTYGTLELGFAYIKVYPPFDQEPRRRDLLVQLNTIPGFNLPADAYNRRPNVPLHLLAGEAEFAQFTGIMQQVMDDLRAERDKLA